MALGWVEKVLFCCRAVLLGFLAEMLLYMWKAVGIGKVSGCQDMRVAGVSRPAACSACLGGLEAAWWLLMEVAVMSSGTTGTSQEH